MATFDSPVPDNRWSLRARSINIRAYRSVIFFWTMTLIVATVASQLIERSLANSIHKWGQTRAVMVTTQRIQSGTVISNQHLASADVPVRFIPDQATASPSLLVGRVATRSITAGAPIDLAAVSPTAGSPLAALVGPGRRGIALGSDRAPGDLRAEDVVDVLVNQDGDGALLVAVRSARVARVDERTVVLSVMPNESESLTRALTHGQPTIVVVGG
jgi:Flp pilus assembly protein CpaB